MQRGNVGSSRNCIRWNQLHRNRPKVRFPPPPLGRNDSSSPIKARPAAPKGPLDWPFLYPVKLGLRDCTRLQKTGREPRRIRPGIRWPPLKKVEACTLRGGRITCTRGLPARRAHGAAVAHLGQCGTEDQSFLPPAAFLTAASCSALSESSRTSPRSIASSNRRARSGVRARASMANLWLVSSR